ncbi:MAG: hypothetical protein L6277_03170, partial [Desulfobacterales bacterium]|nr:hypothetical protein [Desulfobacterales bacterium]
IVPLLGHLGFAQMYLVRVHIGEVLLGEKIEARKKESRGMGRSDKEGGTSPPDLLTWPYDVNFTIKRLSPPEIFPQKKTD